MVFTELSGRKKVRCDECGAEIECCGWMRRYRYTDELADFHGWVETDDHYCDEHEKCAGEGRCEFRICDVCGDVMVEGYVVYDGATHLCEDCFKPWMDENCPEGWRQVDDDGCDGYYEERIGGEWAGTGIFYTTWY